MKETQATQSRNALDIIITMLALGVVIYHLVYAYYLVQGPILHLNTHLALLLTLVFLSSLRKKKMHWMPTIGLIVLTLMAACYVHVFKDDLELRAMFNTPLDLVVGVVLIIVVLEATRSTFGNILPAFALCAILYASVGHFLPEPFHTMAIPWDQVISRLSIGLTGIYGNIIAVSANFIFLFMVFSALIETTGTMEFFVQLGRLIGRRFRSGPAMAAVVTSGLMASISGQAGANITVTGSFTIPLMKKIGYRPEQAAAIEAAASTGGPITPPVMGVAAFLMVGITGIPYHTIITVAALPALFYFFAVGLYVNFQTAKLNITSHAEEVDVKEFLLRAPLFFIPLCLIIFLFIRGYSPMFVGFWAVMSVTLLSFLRKATRPSLPDLVKGLVRGALMGSSIAAVCACIGMVVAIIVATGMGIKLPIAVEKMCGGNMVLLMIFTGGVSAILGMGLPASASYVLVAVAIAPSLIKLGLGILPAHFFAFFFANFSYLTPPVALSAVFASKLANASYFKTSMEAAKAGIGGFILPFMIVWYPILMLGSSEIGFAITGMISCIAALVSLEAGFVGYFFKTLNTFERLLHIVSGLLFMSHLYTRSLIVFAVSVIVFSVACVPAFYRRKPANQILKHAELKE